MRLPQLLQTDIADLGPFFGQAWRWWMGELRAMVPSRLRRYFSSEKRFVVLDFGGETLRPSGLMAWLDSDRPHSVNVTPDMSGWDTQDNPDAVVRLPANQIARKSQRYPRTSPANLRRMIALDLPKLSPLDADSVYFGFRKEPDDGHSSANWADVDIWICRRTVIDEIFRLGQSLGVTVRSITSDRALSAGVAIDNIVPGPRLTPRQRFSRLSTPLLLAGSIVLALCLSILIQKRESDLDARIEAQLAAKRKQVQVIEAQRAEIAQLEQRRDFLPRQSGRLRPGAIVAELSRVLPDDSWVFDLELARNQLRIRGYSASASALIQTLDASALFSATQFRSPIIAAPQGNGERFDIGVSVEAGR